MGLKNTEMQPRTEILLFQASRAQLVEQVIRPQLAGGRLCCATAMPIRPWLTRATATRFALEQLQAADRILPPAG